MSTLSERVGALIGSLGESGHEVARFLGDAGIYGFREDCSACPVANLVRREFPEIAADERCANFGVNDEYVFLPGGGRVDLPSPVAEFVTAFDNGEYVELIDPDDIDEED